MLAANRNPSRRAVLAGIGRAVLGGVVLSTGLRAAAPVSGAVDPSARRTAWWSVHSVCDDLVRDVTAAGDLGAARVAVEARIAGRVGIRVRRAFDGSDGRPGIAIGLGPRLVAAVDPELPGATDLPVFAQDDRIPAGWDRGDLVIAVESTDADSVAAAGVEIARALANWTRSWSVLGSRGVQRGRNQLGFHDELIVARNPVDLHSHVVIPDGPAAGGTVCVMRLLDLDVERFAALDVSAQEALIGRRRSDGAPLSGDSLDDPIDLQARTAHGGYAIPERSHVRAAHPVFTGSSLMLRRSYDVAHTWDGSGPPTGAPARMLFVSYQQTVDTFVATQRRLDKLDDLMTFVSPVASATFLMLPAANRQVLSALAGSPVAGDRR